MVTLVRFSRSQANALSLFPPIDFSAPGTRKRLTAQAGGAAQHHGHMINIDGTLPTGGHTHRKNRLRKQHM